MYILFFCRLMRPLSKIETRRDSSAPEGESRTQGSREGHKKNPKPTPRTALPRTDPLKAKDSNARGQGPRTQAHVLSKKRSSEKFFRRSPKKKIFRKKFKAIFRKKRFPKKFSGARQTFNNSKNSAVLQPRTGPFSRTWGFEAKAKDLTFEAKAKPRPSKYVLEDDLF